MVVAHHTYGRWLGSKIFRLSADAICPSERLKDGVDYVPTSKSVVFGHHFTSIAGTGPIVGPAIAIMWGRVPRALWVVLGSIFIGAVHDFGALVVSLRNNGQTVGDIAGRVLNRRVRLLFCSLMALTVVLAIFGLVIAAVFPLYPAAIFQVCCKFPSPSASVCRFTARCCRSKLLTALGVMYLTVIYGTPVSCTALTPHCRVAHLDMGYRASRLLIRGFGTTGVDVAAAARLHQLAATHPALALILLGSAVAAFIGYTPNGSENKR